MATINGTTGGDRIRTLVAGGSTNGLPNASPLGGDIIFAGDGADTVETGAGWNIVFGGAGNDEITLNGSAIAGPGQGYGDDGDDRLTAIGTGFASLDGGLGNDTITTGAGGSHVIGRSGADLVLGGTGNDSVDAGSSNDTVDGGFGDDTILGGFGADSLFGNDGNDLISADWDADTISGGNGNDTVMGGFGSDLVIGGRGFDRLDGGADFDTLSYSGAGLVRIVVTVAQSRVVKHLAGGVVEVDIIQNFENFIGTAGHDKFTGWGQEETFTGGAGNDTFDGGDGFDTVRYDVAGVGNVYADLLAGFALDGLGGTDRFRKSNPTNATVEMIIAGSGADTLIGDGDANWLRGNTGADSLDGGDNFDYADWSGDVDLNGDGYGVIANLSSTAVGVAGGWGAETLGGTVTVEAGRARDTSSALDMLESIESLRGSNFRDLLVGSAEGNTIRAMNGADTVDGGFGYDSVSHRSDADFNGDGFGAVVNLSSGAVTVAGFGMEASFTLAGGAARDGWGAIDTLTDIEGAHGTFQNDLLVASEREPVFQLGSLSFYAEDRSFLRGLVGADTLRGIAANDGAIADYLDDAAGVVVRLDLGTAEDGWGTMDTLVNVSGAQGSAFDDLLVAAAGGSWLRGRGGDDRLQGGGGIDTASFSSATAAVSATLDAGSLPGAAQDGEGGNDTLIDIENLTGGLFADTLIGNAEANLVFGGGGGDSLDGGGGQDVLSYYTLWMTSAPYFTTGVAVDLALGTVLDGDGSTDSIAGFEHVVGTHLADTLGGDALANTLVGAEGADSLGGGDAGDTLVGGAGADSLDGGAGRDTASYAGSSAAVTINLSLAGAQGGAGEGLGDVLAAVEDLVGSGFADVLTGNSLANRIAAGNGNDRLLGGGGADALLGEAGADTLIGGAGPDTLTGGAGNDAFRFLATNEGTDRITDYAVGADKLHFAGAAFGGLGGGALAAGRFRLNTAADADDRFIFDTATKALSYDADGNGAGAAVTIAVLANLVGTATNISAADIIIV